MILPQPHLVGKRGTFQFSGTWSKAEAAHIAAEVPKSFPQPQNRAFSILRSTHQLQGQGSTVDSSSTSCLSEGMFPLYSNLSTSNSPVAGRLAYSELVSYYKRPIAPPTQCIFPLVISTTCRSVDQAGGKSPPDPPSISRVACLNRSYSETGISAEARTLLMAAWQKNTSSAYGAAWQKWASWCNQQQINPISAPLSAVLDFLTREFNSGKAYRSINVYRSAISMTHPSIDSLRVGEHPMVCQLMKGIFNKRPPLPQYTQTWKVHQVTSYLEGLGLVPY